MELQEFLVFNNAEMIAPIGLSCGMRNRAADFFLLEVIGDKDSPLRFNGRIIAFDEVDACRAALQRLEPLLPARVKVEHKYDFVCNVHRAIEMIMEDGSDRDAVVLNCINTLLDFVATGPFELPEEYTILRSLGDRLTLHGEFGEFTQARSLIRNALLWCTGLACTDLSLIHSLAEFEPLLQSLSVAPNR